MWISLLGLVVGIALGVFFPVTIPLAYTRYTAVGIIGLLDSIGGALRANIQGKYNASIFVSGLIFNMILAMSVTYLGDKLSLDLYLAVLVVFMMRIMKNVGRLRYGLLTRFLGKRRVRQEITTDTQ